MSLTQSGWAGEKRWERADRRDETMTSNTDRVFFYVVPAKTDEFLELAKRFSPHFDEESRKWYGNRDAMDFSDKDLQGAIKRFGEKSAGHYGWMAREYELLSQPAIAAVAAAVAKDVASPTPSVSVTRLETPMPSVEPMAERKAPLDAFAAIAEAARRDGRAFQASNYRYGLQLAIQEGPTRERQLKELQAASPDELRAVTDSNTEAYWTLSKRESEIRFDHASKHDSDLKEALQSLTEKVGPDAARKKMVELFASMAFPEQQRLGALGRDEAAGPVGLEEREKGRMLALKRGMTAMKERYKELTGVEMEGDQRSRSVSPIIGKKPSALLVKRPAREGFGARKAAGGIGD